ncbi:unnamed protein product [Acanthoscelides obtectus]|uniref:Uncharacterized protein n=1 Tax=Acanthoscelides obtectus TaxID=200917 RepID=A0A9P0JTC6_ACAOB|nr:unnamed protein product [Acanthoscelides obtectus]CAK1668954.1 hypothetical protein AOBTE_LOCUS26706 [Acanthoscelides obtectus]
MEPCGSCACSSPEATAYWEYLKTQFEGQTATLQEKEMEIRGKLAVVDNFISSSKQSSRLQSPVPKVFVQRADEPVCDLSYESTNISSTSEKNIPVSFLQRVMENAKSILNLSNNTIRTSMVFPTDSSVNETPTRENDPCPCPPEQQWSSTAIADSSESIYRAQTSMSKYEVNSCSQEVASMMCHACKTYFSGSNVPPDKVGSQMQTSATYTSSNSRMEETSSVTCTQLCSECRRNSRRWKRYNLSGTFFSEGNYQCTTSSCSGECTVCRTGYGSRNQNPLTSKGNSCGRATCDNTKDTQCQDCRSTYEDCTEECTECNSCTYGSTCGCTSGNTDAEVTAPLSQSQNLTCTCATSPDETQTQDPNISCACDSNEDAYRSTITYSFKASRAPSGMIGCACGPSERKLNLNERAMNTSRQHMCNRNVQFEESAVNTARPQMKSKTTTNRHERCSNTCRATLDRPKVSVSAGSGDISGPIIQNKNLVTHWVGSTPRQEIDSEVALINLPASREGARTPYNFLSRSTTTPDISYGTKGTEARQSTCAVSSCPSKKYRSRSDIRDRQNQAQEYRPPTRNRSAGGVPSQGNSASKCCFHCVQTNEKSDQLMRMMAELQMQEREIKERMQELLERERIYDNALNNVDVFHDPYDPNCKCGCREYRDGGQNYPEMEARPPSEPYDDIERVRLELKLENQELKAELMEMKMQLKHTLEKIEGPMKKKLEYEQAKCRKLQQDLEETSTTMMLSQDQYGKEMDNLKMQLCCACANMTELNTINTRLKDELNSLDCICAKLEDDLVKQKLNEAETIKRLAKRSPYSDTVGGCPTYPITGGAGGAYPTADGTCSPCPITYGTGGAYPTAGRGTCPTCPIQGGCPAGRGGGYPMVTASYRPASPCAVCQDVTRETKETDCQCDHCRWTEPFKCDSNLHVIARKLSKTIKETGPCQECSKLPAELTGAAKVIKDLTDLVESRKEKKKESACICESGRDSSLHIIARKLSKTLQDTAPCDICANLPEDLKDAATCIKNLSDLVCSRKEDFSGGKKKKDCFCQSLPAIKDGCCQCSTRKYKCIQETKLTKIVDTQAGTALEPPASQEAPSTYSTPTPSKMLDQEGAPEPAEAPAGVPAEKEPVSEELSAAGDDAEDASEPPGKPAAQEEITLAVVDLAPTAVDVEDPSPAASDDAENPSKPPVGPIGQEEITLAVVDLAPITVDVATGVNDLAPVVAAGKTPSGDLPSELSPQTGLSCGPDAVCAAHGMPCVKGMERAAPLVDEAKVLDLTPPATDVSASSEGAPIERVRSPPAAAAESPPAMSAEPPAPFDSSRPQTPTTQPSVPLGVCPCPPSAAFSPAPPGYTLPMAGFALPLSAGAPPSAPPGISRFDDFEPCPRVCGPDSPCYTVGLPCMTGRRLPKKDGGMPPAGSAGYSQGYGPKGPGLPGESERECPGSTVSAIPGGSLGYGPKGPGFPGESEREDPGGPGSAIPGGSLGYGPNGPEFPGGSEQGGPGGPGSAFRIGSGREGPGSPESAAHILIVPDVSRQFTEKHTGDFPFEVETRAEMLTEPPPGLHVTTTITSSGNLEVITEGPSGVIETILNYTDDGVIEVITYLHEEEEMEIAPGVPGVVFGDTISQSFTEGRAMDSAMDSTTQDSSFDDKHKRKPSTGVDRLSNERHRSSVAAQLEFESERAQLQRIAEQKSFITSDGSLATDLSGGIEGDTSGYSEGPIIGPGVGVTGLPGETIYPADLEEPEPVEVAEGPLGVPETVGVARGLTEMPGAVEVPRVAVVPEGLAGVPRAVGIERGSAGVSEGSAGASEDPAGVPGEIGLPGGLAGVPDAVGIAGGPVGVAGVPAVIDARTGLTVADQEVMLTAIDMIDQSTGYPISNEKGMMSPHISTADKAEEPWIDKKDEETISFPISMVDKEGEAVSTTDQQAISDEIAMVEKAAQPPEGIDQGITSSQIDVADKSSDYPQLSEQGVTASQIEMRDEAATAEGAETSDMDTETAKLETQDAEAYQEQIHEQTSALMYEKESREAGEGAEIWVEEEEIEGEKREEKEGKEAEKEREEGENQALATPESKEVTGGVEKPGESEGDAIPVGAAGEGVVADDSLPEWTELTPITEEGTLETESKTADKLGESLEAAEPKRQKRDCSCQSSPPSIEQSCQCCECKDIGISTSHDSETITEATGDHLDPCTQKASQKSITEEETVEITESGELFTAADDMAPSSDSKAGDQDKTQRAKAENDEYKSAHDMISEMIDGALQAGSKARSKVDRSRASRESTDAKRSSKSKPANKAGSQTGKGSMEEELVKTENLGVEVVEGGATKADTGASQTRASQDATFSTTDAGQPVTGVLSSEVPAELRSLDRGSRDAAGADATAVKPSKTTSSESDSDPDRRKKRGLVDKKKRGSQEVPKSASQVSYLDGKPRKRRSSRLDNAVCDCKGVCQCVVCSKEIIQKRLAATGNKEPPSGRYDQLCCCADSSAAQLQQQQLSRPLTPTQQKGMYQAQVPVGYVQFEALCNYSQGGQPQQPIHPPGCRCRTCRCNPCSPCPPEYESPEQFIRSTDLCSAGGPGARTRTGRPRDRISINDVFRRSDSADMDLGGPSVMSPPIPRNKPYLRYPNQRMEQHPYDCECIDCICIPTIQELAQTREIPPIRDEKQVYQVKCVCPNAQNARKILSQRSRIPISTNPATSPPRVATPTGCTCEVCKCEDDKQKEAPTGEGAALAPSFTHKDQCDCPECECAVCFDKAKRPVGKNEKGCLCKGPCTCEDCSVDKYKKALERVGGFLPKPGYPSDCGCDTCECPESPLKPKRKPKPGHPEDCDCDICRCPKGPNNKPSDCNCDTCICPGGGDRSAPKEAKCDCDPCDCSPCSDPKRRKVGDSRPGKLPPCDCPTCECSPCADPTKIKAIPSAAEGCTCETCDCATEEKMTAVMSKVPHPENCDCPECLCMEEILQTIDSFGHVDECTCEECKCPSDDTTSTQHMQGCTCETCACPGKIDTTTSVPHMEGCTCSVCTCPGATETGVGPTDNVPTHPEGCTCEECKCEPVIEEHPAGCTCTECKCEQCQTLVHEGNCQCPECLCPECATAGGEGGAGEDEKGDAPPAQLINRSCHCLACHCDTCTDPTKVKVERKKEAPAPEVGANCTCKTCICIDCIGREGKADGGDQQPDESTERHPNCKCGVCTCKSCEPTTDQEETCRCGDCKCEDCKYKTQHKGDCACPTCKCRDDLPGGGTAQRTAPSGRRHPNCKCVECTCVECNPDEPYLEKKESECKCGDCKCVECKYKATAAHTPECTCKECKCDGEKKPGEAGAEPGMVLTDPPPFELLKRKSCDCNTCGCVMCNQKAMTTGAGRVQPASGEAPPFQIPVRLPCNCKVCECATCNRDAPKPPPQDVSGTPASGGGGGAAQKIAPYATDEAPPFKVPTRLPCTCATCECETCNKNPPPPPPGAEAVRSNINQGTTISLPLYIYMVK